MKYKNGRLAFNVAIYLKVLPALFKAIIYSIMSRGNINFLSIVEKGVLFYGPLSMVKLGKKSKLERNVVIQSISRHGINIGENCTIGEGTQIRPSSYYGGDVGYGMALGSGSAIGVNSYIGCSGSIVIGENVIIGPRVTMIAENHNFSDAGLIIKKQGVTRRGIKIENNVWIGCNVTILDGVTIGSNCVVAAGAVVNKDISPNSLVAGVPAKLIKMIR